jgi:lipopolysaccharide export system protein LptA
MRNRVERLRVWLLGSAVFLMVVIAAFIWSARYVRHRFLSGLPSKLGIDVKSDANGVTFSHSVEGRTVYTVHAAKKEEHTNGKIALHDVKVELFGRKGDRQDRIQGDEFEYDPKAGVLRAVGLVHIDLQATESGAAAAGESDAKLLHVTTKGLVFLEKLGVAATSEYIEFQAGALKGHATGADYSSDSGMLMLHSAVSMSGIAGGRPVELTAATANYDQHNQEAFLTHAKYDSMGRVSEADQATLHRRPDGSLARVEAQGNVRVQANGATVVSQRADVELNAASQPHSALLTGGVLYTSDQSLRQMRGAANEATIGFSSQAKPQPEHAVFTGAVHMIERTRATEAVREPWSVRELTATKFEAALMATGAGKPQLRNAEATGSAHLTIVNNGSLASAAGEGRTELSGDDLKALLTPAGDGKQPPQLDTIAGRGHTVLHQVSVTGVDQTSTGDTLDAKFRPKSAPAAKGRPVTRSAGKLSAETLWSAVQQGHVTVTRRVPAQSGVKAGSNPHDDLQHAVAERAAYDGELDRITLTGGVQVTDVGNNSMLWANQLVLDRRTGDSHAVGAVKVDYDSAQAGGRPAVPKGGAQQPEPTHILADRAELEHATSIATFYGKPVRLWQGGSQVQAPEIEISREQKRLIARGGGSTGWSAAAQAAQVHTVLVSAGVKPGAPGAAGKGTAGPCATGKAGAGKAGAAAGAPEAVRIASGGLIYSDILRQADFTGGVRADTTDATIRANQVTAYLQQAGAPAQAGEAGTAILPSLAGNLEQVVATGHVDVARPGKQATGERLVYTASDRVFLLTGDGKVLPKAVDGQGTTTGAALRFNACDDSVEALDEVPGSPTQRVRTNARVSDDRKKEKAKR